jgi:hypothetical protein
MPGYPTYAKQVPHNDSLSDVIQEGEGRRSGEQHAQAPNTQNRTVYFWFVSSFIAKESTHTAQNSRWVLLTGGLGEFFRSL